MGRKQIRWNRRELASLLRLTLFMWWTVNRTYGQLIGNRANCDKEGEVVDLPILLGNPCIQCICKNEVISCKRETCPKLDDCALIFTTLGKSCCEKCKICRYNGEAYTTGQRWVSHNDPCQQFECREGVVTASRTHCVAPSCENATIIPGDCCPTCPGCFFEGKLHTEGTTFSPDSDACIKCTCTKGGTTCQKLICPILSCPQNQQKILPGECCPQCVAPRKVFDLGHRCLFDSSVYDDGQNVFSEKCTKCVCLDSTVMCQRTTCPADLSCPNEEIIHNEDECCPKCKPKTCRYAGEVYQEGESWEPHACESCQCVGGEAMCTTETCPATLICAKNHVLHRPDGECCQRCKEKNALCSVFGDPHYRTFDGRLYNFQGTCKYILTSDCHDRTFTVRVRNDGRQTDNFAWTKTVFISISGHQVTLLQDYAVRADKKDVSLPHVIPNVLAVESDGFLIRVTTQIGLEVTWDGDSLVEVSMPPTFKNKLCGLCGNYNGDRLDDFKLRHSNAIADNAEQFAESWVSGTKERCVRPPTKTPAPCEGNPKRRLRAHRECKVLRAKQFESCSEVVDVWTYYRSCISDMCECPKHKLCSCEALRAFVSACQQEGIEVELETTSPCTVGQTCPEGAVFDECGPPCPRTCANRDESSTCRQPCVAGCQCPAGFVMHKNRCIQSDECP
ncbi:BMP-binding endothelial regulator protein-like [Asterias rubens]|uniref:BMP-binding endothelial regulator protein-like n=1 Tax=Asterias rubens TaxID=7604 RepID=UPI0014555578|nr:BMP-binding endothelial regulator protein-like [Asterias rubens]